MMKAKRSTGLFWSQNYLTWILYGIGALLFALIQAAPRFLPTVAHARPTPLLLMAVCVAMLEGPRVGAAVAVLAGLLWDMFSFHIFGLNAIILLCIAVAVGLLVEWLLRSNFLSAMVLCAGGILTHTLLEWLLCYALFLHEEAGMVLVKVYLPNALYTMLLAPLVYGLVLTTARFLRRRKNG